MRIQINTSDKLPMQELWKMALRYCFDKKNVSMSQEHQMRESVFLWANWIMQFKEEKEKRFGPELDQRPVGTRGTYIDEIEFYLGIICYHIEAADNNKPWMVKRQATYKEHGISYLKAYGIPGSWTKEDFVRAMKAQKKAMTENPGEWN